MFKVESVSELGLAANTESPVTRLHWKTANDASEWLLTWRGSYDRTAVSLFELNCPLLAHWLYISNEFLVHCVPI